LVNEVRVADERRVVHIFPAEVLSAQVRLIAAALDEAEIGAAGLELDQVAGEVIRRDVFAALAALGIEFDDGCGWSLLATGGVSMTFHVKLERDLPVIRMFVSSWMPTG
jgi:hypothetical protein